MYLPPEPYSLAIVITMFLPFWFSTSDFSSTVTVSLFSLFLKCLTSKINNVEAIKNASPSANGPAYNIPSIPHSFPNVTIAGIKNSICLDNDNTALFTLFPIAWKNIPDGIWIPLHITNIKYVLNAIQANSI